MRRFEHGGDIYSHQDVMDFSANLNPLGMPQMVRDALCEHVDSFEAYPDPYCIELIQALANMYGILESQVVCTAGVTDLIDRVVRVVRPSAALIAAPCYLGYEQALIQHGVSINYHALRDKDDYVLTDSFLQSVTEDISLVFIANPNNPTGITVGLDLLVSVIERAGDIDAHIVLDESFIEFTDAASMIELIDDYPHLIIMRSFTKSYAMAGLRLGYGVCSDPGFIRDLRDVGQPWAVSTPAQLAGCVALQQVGFIEESRAYTCKAREWLISELRNLGLCCIESDANYIMFQCDKALYEPLLACGILIRRCENYNGLDSSWYRVAVRTFEENEKLIEALEEALS